MTVSLKEYRYDGENELRIKDVSTTAGEHKKEKDELIEKTAKNLEEAALLQDKLYAAKREGLVIALQARDAAGKDSLIKKVFSALNPAGLQIVSFKTPNKTELAHDYLWRINQALPERGTIGVLNRSHYEDVLVVKVHEMEKGYCMPERCINDEDFYKKRYRQLNDWEEYLYENGYRVVKVFLNVSKEAQKERFIDRMELPEKHWKLSMGDMKERALWDEYDEAFEDCINATGTKHAPWYVLPADNKWYTRYLMSEILLETLKDMDPEYPPINPEEAALIPKALQELEKE